MTTMCAAVQGEEQTPQPIEIGSRLELFVDRHLVEKADGLEWRLHEPQKMPLALSPIKGHYLTIIKDGDVFRAYYRDNDKGYTGRRNYSGHPGEITCYAQSRDGHEWTFPVLGLFEVNGTRSNNVILAGMPPFHHNFSPFLDTRTGTDTNARFKALAGHPGFDRKVKGGLHAFLSADGIHWRKASDAPVIPYDMTWTHAFDSQNVAFWSEAEQMYVCYLRTWTKPENKEPSVKNPEAGSGLRSISRATSPDFKNWSKPVAMNPNLPGEHLYTSQTHPYFRAPHIYIALPSRYMAGRIGAEKADLMKGSTDILLMTSRAGSTKFDRLFTEAFLRPGLDPACWESRANYVALNVLPTGPAEMSIWHSKSGHRYLLRTDGFISVRAGAQAGELLSKPLIFSGNQLVLNYSTSAAGVLLVEIQDAAGLPLPGFRLQDCAEIVGDQIERVVQWNGNPNLAALEGKPVRLRFVLKEADIYSFRFQKSSFESSIQKAEVRM